MARLRDGIRRYVFAFIDPCSRFAFAWAAARRTLDELTPVPIRYALSDNGSEFIKDFKAELQRRHITHWQPCPKSPKMNAHCGRFNRALAGWLVFYNTERPHQALALRSPVQSLFISHPERQRYLSLYIIIEAWCPGSDTYKTF